MEKENRELKKTRKESEWRKKVKVKCRGFERSPVNSIIMLSAHIIFDPIFSFFCIHTVCQLQS